jgi:hypothetical protein
LKQIIAMATLIQASNAALTGSEACLPDPHYFA